MTDQNFSLSSWSRPQSISSTQQNSHGIKLGAHRNLDHKITESKKTGKIPSWIVGIGRGLAKAAAVLGIIACSAVALGLLPVTVIGLGILSKGYEHLTRNKNIIGNIERAVGLFLAAPAVGVFQLVLAMTEKSSTSN